MAKVAIKSEKLTPFGGIFSIMEQFDSKLSSVIDSTLGMRCRLYGYQYSEIIRSLLTPCHSLFMWHIYYSFISSSSFIISSFILSQKRSLISIILPVAYSSKASSKSGIIKSLFASFAKNSLKFCDVRS